MWGTGMPMSAAQRKWAWNLLRIGVCLAAVWWVLSQLNWEQVRDVWQSSDLRTVAVGFLIFLPVPVLQSIRFVWMLKAQDISLSYWESIKLNLTGNFFNMFVPAGSLGGDVVKAYYVAQHTSQKTEAVTAVLLDRVVGLLSFVIFAVAGLALKFDDRTRPLALWLGVLVTVIAAVVAVAFSQRLRTLLGLERVAARLPMADQVRRIGRATLRMREHISITIAALLATLVLQAFVLGSFAVAAVGLGMKPDIVGYYGYLALSLIIAAIPISPGGLGTMEAAMIFLLGGAGYGDDAQIVLLALAMRAIQLFWALPGGGAFVTGACRPDPDKLAQLQADTADPVAGAQ